MTVFRNVVFVAALAGFIAGILMAAMQAGFFKIKAV